MAYQRPMVMVYQEYNTASTTTTTTTLPACIIGPCYHIIDPAEDETLALFGEYTRSGISNGMFPNNAYGALIERETVSFRFKNAIIELFGNVQAEGSTTSEDGVVSSPKVTANKYPVTNASILESLKIGDFVNFSDGTQLRIIDILQESKTLMLNRTCPNSEPVSISRKIEEFTIPYDAPGVTLDVTSERFSLVGIKYENYFVISSELYVGYKSLRQDLSNVMTIFNIDELRGKLGKITPDNPLAFGVSVALANGTEGVLCVAVNSDDLKGYTAAKNRIEFADPVYGIVPLTFDTGILTMFKNHCIEFSKPEISKWRMAFGCTRLVTTRVVVEDKGRMSRDGDGDFVIFTSTDPHINFFSSGVDTGDILTVTAPNGKTYDYTIASVVSEDILTITQSAPFDDTAFEVGTDYNFKITHNMNLEEQAEWIRDASKAYGDKHFVNIYPDVCVVNDYEVPGYYLGCAVASGIASLPSHYGMTRLSLSGVSAVYNSSDHFNSNHLDTIASGGTFIFIQANPNSAPYIRHQLTTDMSVVEYQEVSFVKNFDYVSYACRDVLDAFLGKWNITPQLLEAITTALNGKLELIKLDSQPKIGSRLLNYNIVSISQLADVRDRVEAYIQVSMPYPLNTIGLHMQSVFLQITSASS